MTRMTLALCCAVAVWSSCDARAAFPPPSAINASGASASGVTELAAPRASAAVVGANPAYVGQMMQVEVELWRDGRSGNQSAPFFPELHVRGAISVLSPTAPPPEEREAGGVTFLVQKRRYLLFPQRPGDVQVPPFRVVLPVPGSAPIALQTPPVELIAMAIPKTDGPPPLVARHVQISREVDGDLEGLRVGDAFTVSVRVTAEDTHAIVLPPHSWADLAGLTLYPQEPRTSTRAVRGQYRAERIDTATYVARDWGRYTLPRASMPWLDPETGELREVFAHAVHFRARMNPSLGLGCIGGPAAAARAGGVLLLATLGLVLARRLSAGRARAGRSQGEQAAFAAVLKAARSGRDGPTLTALYRWLHFGLAGVPTLEGLREADHDPQLSRTTEALEDRVCKSSTAGSARELVAPLSHYRRSQRSAPARGAELPELNPRVWRADSREQRHRQPEPELKTTKE